MLRPHFRKHTILNFDNLNSEWNEIKKLASHLNVNINLVSSAIDILNIKHQNNMHPSDIRYQSHKQIYDEQLNLEMIDVLDHYLRLESFIRRWKQTMLRNYTLLSEDENVVLPGFPFHEHRLETKTKGSCLVYTYIKQENSHPLIGKQALSLHDPWMQKL